MSIRGEGRGERGEGRGERGEGRGERGEGRREKREERRMIGWKGKRDEEGECEEGNDRKGRNEKIMCSIDEKNYDVHEEKGEGKKGGVIRMYLVVQ